MEEKLNLISRDYGIVIAQFVLGFKGKVNEGKLMQRETILSLSPQQEVSFYLGW
jgi:hypothetical protein